MMAKYREMVFLGSQSVKILPWRSWPLRSSGPAITSEVCSELPLSPGPLRFGAASIMATPAVTATPGAGAALSRVPRTAASASGKKVLLLTVAAALLGASGAMGVLVLRRAMKLRGDRRRRRKLLESIPGPDLKAVGSSPRNGRRRKTDSVMALLRHLLLGQGSGMSEQEGHEELVRRAGGLGKLLVTAHEQYGAVVRLVLDNELFVSINDPEVLSQLRVQRLDKRVEGLDFLRGLLGPNSVGFKKGDDAKKRRQLLHKLFTKQSLDLLVPSFCACIARHVSALPSCPQPVEVQAPMRQLWMSLNALNVFGTEHDTVPLCESFGESLNLLLRLRFAPKDSVSDDDWRRLHAALHKLHSDIDAAIALHSSRPAPSSPPRDLLGLLLGEPSLTPQDVHDEVTTFLFATFENYTILSNTLHHLGKRPDLQRRLRQEWAQAFADRNPRSLEELWSGLRLAKDVVKESLRLSVVGAQTWRVTDEECPIGIPSRRCAHTGPVGGGAEDFGHNGLPAAALAAVSGAGGGAGSGRGKGREVVLPKGTSIIIPMVSIHRNPKLWLNGDMFDPDRFRDGTAGDQHPLAFIPFGFGTRMCLGYRFALEISALVVSMVCKDLHLEACNDPVWEEASFNWYAKRGLYLKLTPLNQPPPSPTDSQPRPSPVKQQPPAPIPPPIITAQPVSSMPSGEASHEPSQQQDRGGQEEAQSQRRDRHSTQEAQQQ